jgi:Ala-tRNA(Pro) deacylase
MTEQAQQTNAENGDDLPVLPQELFAKFDELGINYTLHEHEAVYTVEESSRLDADIPGTHCRNLFLRDKKKRMYLVIAPNERGIDLKKLQAVLDCGRLSFGSADRLWQHLGVYPGAVCPFALINDRDLQVQPVLDKGMMAAERVNYHPLDNSMTVGVSPDDLRRFIDFCGHQPQIINLETVAPDA